MTLRTEVIGSAPIDRIDVFYGKDLVRTVRGFDERDLGRRIRVIWEGAEYRGRGREVVWKGTAKLIGNRYSRVAPVNFLNPEHSLDIKCPGTSLGWTSVTTGNMSGFDMWLEDAEAGSIAIETNVVAGNFELSAIGMPDVVVPGGGLGRQIRIFRLPEENDVRHVVFDDDVRRATDSGADLPVYVRVTQEDGHQAWSSPIYLIA